MRHRSSVPRRVRWLAIASLAGAAGCGVDSLDTDVTTSLELPEAMTALRVRVALGDITVGTHEGERTLRIEGRLRRSAADPDDFEALAAIRFVPELRPTEEPGVYEFATPSAPAGVDPARSAIIFRAYLSLPAGLAIDVATQRGTLEARSRKAPVKLRTGLGELVVRDTQASADIATLDGKVFVVGHRGALVAQSGDPERPTLSGGAIVARVDELAAEGVQLRTNGPSLQIDLPADGNFELDAAVTKSAVGKLGIRNGFGLPVLAEGEGHRCRGRVGRGGPSVRLELHSGWLSIPSRSVPPNAGGTVSK